MGACVTGTLLVIGTPIGNLDDLTKRAADALRSADVCYAEDTRRTRGLLSHLGAETPLRSLHEHNERSRVAEVLDRLEAGETVALVSDAGTPTVSDPGRRVLAEVLDAGHRVSPVPGSSAVVAALSVSGLPADRFTFAGFPPRRGSAREAWVEVLHGSRDTTVAFEAPGRLLALLEDLAAAGLAGRRAVVCRELTKLYEEVSAGTIAELATVYGTRTVKGEVTVVISGDPAGDSGPDLAAAEEGARDLARAGLSRRDIADRLVSDFELSRNEAYRVSLSVEKSLSDG